MPKLYRLYTECKNEKVVLEIADTFFAGYTVYHAKGKWEGKEEASLILELVGNEKDGEQMEELARLIGKLNQQECVIITEQEIKTIFIYPKRKNSHAKQLQLLCDDIITANYQEAVLVMKISDDGYLHMR